MRDGAEKDSLILSVRGLKKDKQMRVKSRNMEQDFYSM